MPPTDPPFPSGAVPPLVVWARRFPPTGWGVRGARTFASATVVAALRATPAGSSPAAVDAVARDIALVTSELATNAVRHAATPFEVVLDFSGGHVRVEVRDGSPAVPGSGEPDHGATGRGLAVVDRLASSWGIEVTERGKVVWAQLRLEVLARDRLG
jgi:anti-sigma regulatory factor (Ser/Thr protein kinase)